MDRSLLGKILMGVGVVLVAAGVVVLLTGSDDTPVSAGDAETASASSITTAPSTTAAADSTSTTAATATPPSTSTSTTSIATTSTTTAPAATETAEEFFAILKGALDGGDAATLLERMNQATVGRYGADQCEAYAASVAGTGLDATLIATSDLASWDYTTDDATTTLSGVVVADLERTINDQTVPQTTHWQLVDGRYTWFTDCGSPV